MNFEKAFMVPNGCVHYAFVRIKRKDRVRIVEFMS